MGDEADVIVRESCVTKHTMVFLEAADELLIVTLDAFKRLFLNMVPQDVCLNNCGVNLDSRN